MRTGPRAQRAAYVFDLVAGEWRESAKLRRAPGANDMFGMSVGIASDRSLLVGGPLRDQFGSSAGLVATFEFPVFAVSFCRGLNCPCGNDDPVRGCANVVDGVATFAP